MSARSKRDLPLAKAISNGRSTSGTMYLRRGEKACAMAAAAGVVRICDGNSLQTLRSVREWGEVLQVPEQGFTCSLW